MDSYTTQCKQMLVRWRAQKPQMEAYYDDIEDFFKQYCPECQAALNRLVKIGLPATDFYPRPPQPRRRDKNYIIAQTVQHFITTVDGLQLNLKAVDEIHPLLNDLMNSIKNVPSLPADHISKVKVQHWMAKLNKMKASDELSDDDIRQMTFDLENAYTEFVDRLKHYY